MTIEKRTNYLRSHKLFEKRTKEEGREEKRPTKTNPKQLRKWQ